MNISRKIAAGLIAVSVACSGTAVANAQSSLISLSSSSSEAPVAPAPKSDADRLQDAFEEYISLGEAKITEDAEAKAEEYLALVIAGEIVPSGQYGDYLDQLIGDDAGSVARGCVRPRHGDVTCSCP